MKYCVELFGYNDGLPYLVKSETNREKAQKAYDKARKENPLVGFRLVEVLREDGPLRQDNT